MEKEQMICESYIKVTVLAHRRVPCSVERKKIKPISPPSSENCLTIFNPAKAIVV
jgi:hypothetical protein